MGPSVGCRNTVRAVYGGLRKGLQIDGLACSSRALAVHDAALGPLGHPLMGGQCLLQSLWAHVRSWVSKMSIQGPCMAPLLWAVAEDGSGVRRGVDIGRPHLLQGLARLSAWRA